MRTSVRRESIREATARRHLRADLEPGGSVVLIFVAIFVLVMWVDI